ncbi:MAG: HAMP domain-containing sensor histidine kinase [Pseudomonadota bacterium]|nr:HAMP domain-containing sensor histidine kinase [Pseudomonadota bacterium]
MRGTQSATAETGEREAEGAHRSLSARLLVFTMLAVMLAEVLIFVPSIARFRHEWLVDKLETAAVAGLASADPDDPATLSPAEGILSSDQQADLLEALDARLIAVSGRGSTRLIARDPSLSAIDETLVVDEEGPIDMIGRAFAELFTGGEQTLRVLGPVGDGRFRMEVVLEDGKLRRDMLVYSRNIFFLSLVVAAIAGLCLWAFLRAILIRPIQRLTTAMLRFGERPSDPNRIIKPSLRDDEIGIAERELAAMQRRLAETLREQRHLADLGLAVSKINHDLRNILASAQMISDRLSTLPDPRVQRIAPMLLKSLDRALHYTQSVLAYGRAVEAKPNRRQVDLHQIVCDVRDLLSLGNEEAEIEFVNAVPQGFELSVDPEQIHRLLTNLCRNAVQALQSDEMEGIGIVRRLTIGVEPSMKDRASSEVLIFVEDTGPGLPTKARENLFQAFRGSARSGGTGLGLAIAAEIVEAHGGRIDLANLDAPGARFEITLPTAIGEREDGEKRTENEGR